MDKFNYERIVSGMKKGLFKIVSKPGIKFSRGEIFSPCAPGLFEVIRPIGIFFGVFNSRYKIDSVRGDIFSFGEAKRFFQDVESKSIVLEIGENKWKEILENREKPFEAKFLIARHMLYEVSQRRFYTEAEHLQRDLYDLARSID